MTRNALIPALTPEGSLSRLYGANSHFSHAESR